MRRLPQSSLVRYSVAVLTVALGLFITLQVELLYTRTPFALLLFAVFVSTWFGGRRPGILAVILAGFVSDYFIIPPFDLFFGDFRNTFQIIVFLACRASGQLANGPVSSRKIEPPGSGTQ